MKSRDDMKAVVMAAGEGKRLQPLTFTRPKPMIPIAGKPHLELILEYLKNAGISEVILIVGYKQEQITDYFQDGSAIGLKIDYVTQEEQLGTGHAALCAQELVQSEPFLLMNGDILISQETFVQLLKQYKASSRSPQLSVVKVPDPSAYGIIQFKQKTGEVLKIIEKPTDRTLFAEAYTNAGLYILHPNIFEAIQKTPKSPRGEIEITDSIQRLINQGESIKCFKIEGFWLDLGKPWELFEATHHILDKMESSNQGTIEENVKITGTVSIGAGTLIRSGSYLVGPIFIGKDCNIGPNCYIRSYCSIGDDVHIGHACELKNTIILDHSSIPHLSYIGDSVIGSYVNLGAGTITANLRFDKKSVLMTVKGEKIDTGQQKLGTIIGDYVQTGIGTTIMPGVKIGPYTCIGPNTNIWEDIPPNTNYIKKE
jgi:bifunctional UDP-N-acetylglucosamine pyrophosphorylase/glucosamine-1-phosphate N-acetyltransferase